MAAVLCEQYLRTVTFAVRFLASLLVSVITHTLIGAHHVLANSVGTYSAGARTLVDICQMNRVESKEPISNNLKEKQPNVGKLTFAGPTVGCKFVTRWTFAAETSGRVDALASSAESRRARTLVDVFRQCKTIREWHPCIQVIRRRTYPCRSASSWYSRILPRSRR